MSYKCTFCNQRRMKIISSDARQVHVRGIKTIKRRRYECPACKQRFTTYEITTEERTRLQKIMAGVVVDNVQTARITKLEQEVKQLRAAAMEQYKRIAYLEKALGVGLAASEITRAQGSYTAAASPMTITHDMSE